MKSKHIKMYMSVAEVIAAASESKKLKVGAVAVKGDMIIGDGYNGTPNGFRTNEPEYARTLYNFEDLPTRPEVIHAEMNMLAKITRSGNSSVDAHVFCTHAPCIKCAIHMHQAGITKLFYRNDYKKDEGLNFLHSMNVEAVKV